MQQANAMAVIVMDSDPRGRTGFAHASSTSCILCLFLFLLAVHWRVIMAKSGDEEVNISIPSFFVSYDSGEFLVEAVRNKTNAKRNVAAVQDEHNRVRPMVQPTREPHVLLTANSTGKAY
jgi:hypothetical protein